MGQAQTRGGGGVGVDRPADNCVRLQLCGFVWFAGRRLALACNSRMYHHPPSSPGTHASHNLCVVRIPHAHTQTHKLDSRARRTVQIFMYHTQAPPTTPKKKARAHRKIVSECPAPLR